MKTNEQDCRERIGFLERTNKGKKYVCCPSYFTDHMTFREQYKKMINGELPPISLKEDKYGVYEVWEVEEKVNEADGSIDLHWISAIP